MENIDKYNLEILRFNDFDPSYHYEDCIRIQDILKKRRKYMSLSDIQNLWIKHSDNQCAGWLNLPKDDDEIYTIVFYMSKNDSR